MGSPTDIVDIGAGAGFPSIPLKIVYPELSVTIVDSLTKRITFLQHLFTVLQLTNCKAISARAEEYAIDHREQYDVVMANGEAKILSTHISEPSDRYTLQWGYSDFRLAEGQSFPMRMDVQVLDGDISKGGLTLYYSRIQTNVPVSMDFSIPAKYNRMTLDQILKSLTNIKK